MQTLSDSNRSQREATEHSAHGPWPFVTHREFILPDNSRLVWQSRRHRKRLILGEIKRLENLATRIMTGLWLPRELNWWIGLIFAVGSTLFILASALLIFPGLAAKVSLGSDAINRIFFAGSIPFTIAAYLQLFQAANAPPNPNAAHSDTKMSVLGWRPKDIGWLSCAFQFVGTLLFNVNTFDAMIPTLSWFQYDLVVWVPNLVGSILFLISGFLAFMEYCHGYWAWKPKEVSWWLVAINLFGCIGFMVSALLAVSLPSLPEEQLVFVSVCFTFQGAICFLVGALLMQIEATESANNVGVAEK